MTKRILLADDHKLLRDGLRSLLEKQPDLEVVGEAEDGRSAVLLTQKLRPDIVIMDVAMPNLNGIEATRHITSRLSGTRVIALSAHSDRRFVTGVLEAGASAYLLKECAYEELVFCVRSVLANKTYLSPGVAGDIIRDYRQRVSNAKAKQPVALTPREREVLQVLAEGKTTKEIAGLLGVSIKTIETYRKRIMDRLDLHSVAELTKYAIREGLTSLDH